MLEQARTEIDEIGVKITKTRENFNDLMKTYMLKPKKPNQQPEPKDFFDKWTSFSSEFKGTSFLSAFLPVFHRYFTVILDLWEREVRRFIKEAKLAEKRLAQAKVEEMRKQHNSSRENQRTSTTSGDTTGCSTPPMRKSKLKSRLRESKTMDQIKS